MIDTQRVIYIIYNFFFLLGTFSRLFLLFMVFIFFPLLTFFLLFGDGVAALWFIPWCIAWCVFFAWRRWKRGAVYPPILEWQVRFLERYVSGCSHKNGYTRAGGAVSTLIVKVTADAVLVEPIAPIKWVLPYGFDDLEHFIPRKNIKKIVPTSQSWWGPERVVIESVADGQTKVIELFLRKRRQFLAALT